MIHKVAGRKLGRTSNQRRALFRSLANQLILHEKIVTSEAKAKAVRPMVEKLVTRAKTDSIHSRRMLLKELVAENTVKKMLELIGPKFKERPGGYTRIVKMGARAGDRSPQVTLMFVEAPSAVTVGKKAKAQPTKNTATEEKKAVKPAVKRTAKKETNAKETK